MLRLLSRLVPAERRGEWLDEWTAERACAPSRGRVYRAALEDAAALRAGMVRSGWRGADGRYAVRSLRRRPGFVAIVVLTLALGIGSTLTVASTIRGVLLRPLPYPDAEALALVTTAFSVGPGAGAFPASLAEYVALKEQHPAFSELAAYWATNANLGGADRPLRVSQVMVTANGLRVLGVQPDRGRGLGPGDDRPGAERVAILTHGLWSRAFGADETVLGGTVFLDERPHVVVGILPPEFEFPGVEVEVVTALVHDPADPGNPSSHWVRMIGRLGNGFDIPGARAATRDLLARWEDEGADAHQPSNDHHPVLVESLRAATTGDLGGPLATLSAAVLLVLLVACLNVAALLMVQGESREREFGIRAALGASRGTMLRQLVTESGIVALLAGVAGIGLAAVLLGVLPRIAGDALPPNATLPIDLPVLGVGLALVAVFTFSFGLIPIVGARLGDGVLRSDQRSTAGRRRLAVRRGLVVAEVAMAVALLAGAAVLGRGVARLLSVETGLDPEGVVLFDVELTAGSYPETRDVAELFARLKERAEADPGVLTMGTIRDAPLSGSSVWESVSVDGAVPPEDGDPRQWTVQYQVADPGVFGALSVPVQEGRSLSPLDLDGSPPVVVVNRSAVASLVGPREDILGRRIRLGGPGADSPNPWMEVVGIVGDVRQTALDQDPPPQIYVPRAQAGAIYSGMGARMATVVVRGTDDPPTTIARVQAHLRELDPALPVADARTLDGQLQRSAGDRRFVALVMGFFSVAAVVLGAVGLYGLLSTVVARRSREFGIRYALGAARRRVMQGVVGEALTLVTIGGALGVIVALAGGELLAGLVFGISPRDPVTLIAAPLVLGMIGVLAAWLPARRASAVDPVEVLREE